MALGDTPHRSDCMTAFPSYGKLRPDARRPITLEQPMTSLSSADTDRLRQAFLRCRDMEGTLGEQLKAYAAAGREIFPAYGEAVDRLVARINENGGGENAPRPGEAMPPFLLPDETGKLVELVVAAGQRTACGDVLSRSLVSVLPLECQSGCSGHGADHRGRRPGRGDHAGNASLRRAIQGGSRCTVSGADRSRQRLCAFAQSRDLAGHRNPAAPVLPGHGELSWQ